ncbi:pyridoxal phosphate-dependent aminotransferase [Asticcacaulis machinosus]|uniref:Pyridoxal phosphate-dependent aminotransferase n=1 Tax=Asticcacaulis machinosus TaxID=2984211 RepID=A0ABT5HNB8_9CAUL|nr:pyridoxal phosphate-dependent aminotransferase [Asticcacaulis machinosus]MDC7677715.1 pyridoxal phosphate-dependent aminotransferase [Asticcacaulis machinosus]
MNISSRLSRSDNGLVASPLSSVADAQPPLSYAQWVRQALADRAEAFVLFDSSVDEPKALLQQTIREGFADGFSDRYTSAFVSGNPYVLKALSRRYDVPQDHILTTSAATTAIALVYRAYVSEGEHILVETPRFDLLATTALDMGIEVEDFQRTGQDYAINIDDLRARIRPDTRLIVLSDLHNPSGMLLDSATLTELAELARTYGLKIVVDEVYGDYADSARPRSAVHYSSDFIAINSLTKIYGLSSLRCGWILGTPEALAPVREVAGRYDFTTSNLSHAVAALVLEADDTYDAYRRQVMAQTRPVMAKFFDLWHSEGLIEGQMPEHGCICFPKLTGIDDTIAFSDWLAKTHNVRVAPGEYFGAAGSVRIGFAKDITGMTAALERMTHGLRQYRHV